MEIRVSLMEIRTKVRKVVANRKVDQQGDLLLSRPPTWEVVLRHGASVGASANAAVRGNQQ